MDCTLRDGAHVNDGNFGETHICNIIKGLTNAGADIVEIGFLKEVAYQRNVSSYPQIEQAYAMLDKAGIRIGADNRTKYAVMARADQYGLKGLTPCNGRIDIIRIAFYYDYYQKALNYARHVQSLGYKFTLNLINTPGNSLKELSDFARHANEIHPYIVTIVDTYGVLYLEDLEDIVSLYDSILHSDIKIGLHVHENLSMAFTLVQGFIKKLYGERDIVVDGSLMGIGRAPGNMCSELLTNYLNERYRKDYDLSLLMGLIEDDIRPIRRGKRWGYSPEFFISARHKVHRSYAETMYESGFSFPEIERIISHIGKEQGKKYDKVYLEELIRQYKAGGVKE